MSLPMVLGYAGEGPLIWQEALRLGQRLLPPFPGPEVVPLVQTKPPQKLDPALPDIERAEFLCGAYRAAFEARYPDLGSCWYGTRGDLKSYRDYGKMLRCAELFVEFDIAPLAWVLFSLDVWAAYIGRGPATVSFVFTEARIRERREWFEQEECTYTATRTLFTDEHRDLMQRWRDMQQEILLARPKTRDELAGVVDKHFPGDAYEVAVERAKKAARYLEGLVADATARGAVWVG